MDIAESVMVLIQESVFVVRIFLTTSLLMNQVHVEATLSTLCLSSIEIIR